MSHIVAGMAGRGIKNELGKWVDPEHRRKRLAQSLGIIVVGFAGFSAVGDNLAEIIPITQGTTLGVGNQNVIDINLDLEKVCYTGFTTEVAATAKYSNKLGELEWLWKSQTANFNVDTELCMDATTAKTSIDQKNRHITVRIDNDAITSDVSIVPGSVFSSSDMSPTAMPVENVMNLFKSTPFVEDADFIKDAVRMNDGADSMLANTALTSGLKAVGDNCTEQVWPTVESTFVSGVAKSVLLGAKLYDPGLTEEDVTVLIGDATDAEQNLSQIIGKKTSVDKAYASLQELRKKENTLTVNNDTVGKCEVSESVKAAAKKQNTVSSAQNGGK